MKIILLEKITNLGKLGEEIEVKSGFARNFLIPKKKAVLATKKNIEHFKSLHKEIEKKLESSVLIAQERANKIKTISQVVIISKIRKKNIIFGSIGTKDIANAITNLGANISKKEIRLPNGNIRTVGHHTIKIQLHNQVKFDLTIIVSEKK